MDIYRLGDLSRLEHDESEMRILFLKCPCCQSAITVRDLGDGTGLITGKCRYCKREFEYRNVDAENMKVTIKRFWKN